MSEEKNYINLAYKEKEIKISIPSNYEELKDNFCDEFEEEISKDIKFSYLYENDEYYINEDNFKEAIETIKKSNNQTINVFVNEKDQNTTRKTQTFGKKYNNQNENELQRKNCFKINGSLNNNNEYIIAKAIEKNNNNNNNNFFEGMDNYNQNENNNSLSSSDNKSNEYKIVKEEKVLKESKENSLEINDLKEKEKEIEELKKRINELKEEHNKINNEKINLSKILEDQKNKNINIKSFNQLQEKLKETEEKLKKEQTEKNKLYNDKKEIEIKYKELENQVSNSQLNFSKEFSSSEYNRIKENNKKLIDAVNKHAEEIKNLKEKLENEKYEKKKLKIEENDFNNNYSLLKEQNLKLQDLNKIKDIELEKAKNIIKELEEEKKNSENNDLNLSKTKGYTNETSSSYFNNFEQNEKSKIIKKKSSQKKSNKLEYIKKKYEINKSNLKLNLAEKKKKLEDEQNYNREYIQNSKIKLNSKKDKILGKINLDNIEKEQNNIKPQEKNEILEFKKQIKEKEGQIGRKKEEIEKLKDELKKIKNENDLNNKTKYEEFEKQKLNYQNKINELENQIKNKNNLINENQAKLILSEKEKKSYEQNIKSYENQLKEKNNQIIDVNNKLKELQKEKVDDENKIKQFKAQIEEFNSQLTKSQINQNTQKQEYDLKLKEFQSTLEKKYKELYQNEINQAVKSINDNIEKRKIDLQKQYDIYYKNMENNYNQKFSQMSNLMLQNQNNMSKCKTIHDGIKCNKCLKLPIIGYRYRCSICNDYNLCDECEENNSKTNSHPHLFIKIRNPEPINNNNNYVNRNEIHQKKNNYNNFNANNHNMDNNNNNNMNNNNNFNFNINDFKKQNIGNNDNDFEFIKFGKEISYDCLNKDKLKIEIQEGQNEAELEVVLKNNGTTQWPMNKTKLIANDKKNLIGKNIELEPQNPDDIKKYIVNFNELKPYPPGDYTAGFFFEVDGKKYGDDIELDIIIKDKAEDEEEKHKRLVQEFRDEYTLSEDAYSDEKLLQVLKQHNFNIVEAFTSLFE